MLTFPEFDTELFDLQVEETGSGELRVSEFEMPFFEACGASLDLAVIVVDTMLPCNFNWSVALPSSDLSWEDGSSNSERLLSEIGSYRARNTDCSDPVVYEYQLNRAICDCLISLPNAFSPNGDGINDVVSILTDCQIEQAEALVYDRWGNLIHRGKTPEQLWDGTSNQSQVGTGVYVLMISYQLLSESGGQQNGTLTREILLVR